MSYNSDTGVLPSVPSTKDSDIIVRKSKEALARADGASDLGTSEDLGDLADVLVERYVGDSYHLENFMYLSDGKWEKSDAGVRTPLTQKDVAEIKKGPYILIRMRSWSDGREYALCKKYK